ncbi:translation initiation factor eIF2B subunit alpha-like [Sycon ciliatum]|uniref:translation initiation factor eIF2B subunit alpha-like n=1 Tax=Sycon ciliatum TaxID=27933 RepID=UPI0031F6BEB5|eukprot:scpid30910/ scgid14224/ Translation initiation factor eIF-2B subunit alpha; eIF-2B GDP-GTP exchange factor subunit alpha
MKNEDVLTEFKAILRNEPHISAAVAAIKILSLYIESSEAGTLQELNGDLKVVIAILTGGNVATMSVESGCELFLRFITLTSLDNPDFVECKKKLLERGRMFMQLSSHSRDKIADLGLNFLRDGATILVHSYSRVVLQLILKASAMNRCFTIYITESQPDRSGYRMRDKLKEHSIHADVVLDSAIGYLMRKVDLVMVGAEGVCASGGIVNKIGTYPMAVMAKELNKPFYCVAESFKFVRFLPLSQADLPTASSQAVCVEDPSLPPSSSANGNVHNAECNGVATAAGTAWDPARVNAIDYTPAEYITLLFTDLGVLTPSAVSDELIKLYL